MRLLTPADVPQALELSAAAGWNQTREDWNRMIELEPFGCFGIEADDRLVATATLLTYGRDMAWIGMVLTHADYQRRGYARLLVTAALELAAARGIPCTKLDATDQGRPLYTSLGFEDEQPIERWTRGPAEVKADPVDTGLLDQREDRLAFGADRTRFIRTLGDPLVDGKAYAIHRPGARAHYLGPCVARNTATAYGLIAATLAKNTESTWYWDLLPSNPAAVALARDFGFEPARRLVRMVRGEPIRGEDSMVFAIAGFEAG
jgi:GNAT superfamily N-acetyltransferase